ncbi:unnamed protein product, partial [Ilex paraguariensis]
MVKARLMKKQAMKEVIDRSAISPLVRMSSTESTSDGHCDDSSKQPTLAAADCSTSPLQQSTINSGNRLVCYGDSVTAETVFAVPRPSPVKRRPPNETPSAESTTRKSIPSSKNSSRSSSKSGRSGSAKRRSESDMYATGDTIYISSNGEKERSDSAKRSRSAKDQAGEKIRESLTPAPLPREQPYGYNSRPTLRAERPEPGFSSNLLDKPDDGHREGNDDVVNDDHPAVNDVNGDPRSEPLTTKPCAVVIPRLPNSIFGEGHIKFKKFDTPQPTPRPSRPREPVPVLEPP